MNDYQIRTALKHDLEFAYRSDTDTVILEELGLRHGAARVDLVVVNGSMHGFELKSDRDTLKRLPRQAALYSGVLDYITLVVARRHVEEGTRLIPHWWGIKLTDLSRDGVVDIIDIRKPTENPSPDRLAIAKLLWRSEALALLEEVGGADGLRSKPRGMIHARVAEMLNLDLLRARVRRQLRCRTNWRSGELRTSGGG
ncbi:MAG: sce7726 family protein [Acidobacteria bacterium]|nr:sce7726 family protein [Acidobacteriota bacterium]